MTRAQVEALYGQPDSTLEIALRGGGTGILARYTVKGGLLLVEYAGDRVVSIETTSPFFETAAGSARATPRAACTATAWTTAPAG